MVVLYGEGDVWQLKRQYCRRHSFFVAHLSHEKELRAKLSEILYNKCRKRDRL